MKVFIRTFGCQMNDVDSERLIALLEGAGYKHETELQQADVVIVNTCSVRQQAETRALAYLSSLKSLKKKGKIFGLIGCTASLHGQAILERYPFIDIVCGPGRLPEFLLLLKKAIQGQKAVALGESPCPFLKHSGKKVEIAASVPVTKGCNNFCTYCVVPFTRGKLLSRAPQEIIDEVKMLAEAGVREVTLLGQNVNEYGQDRQFGQTNFVDLLEKVHEVSGVQRLRFLTSHPKDIPEELLKCFLFLPKLYRHLHLPLQSGSERILEMMNRGYTFNRYLAIVEKVRSLLPEISISSDILVGLPPETERDFEQTMKAVKEIRFTDLFIFKYSPRPGTVAATWEDVIPTEVKKTRHQQLLNLQKSISESILKEFCGKPQSVFCLRRSSKKSAYLLGRTNLDIPVIFKGSEALIGQEVRVMITESSANLLRGYFYPGEDLPREHTEITEKELSCLPQLSPREEWE
ncbi:MAG: tRNA (N6-isopentenyl adenosine(37)-C2)-methylthiotransferase MiaB [Candidatus Omnitrophica bacterium]|nr:tRNA (N6-isopentenyl adenosine(37)-C2)-methylthiotransferase MiaB [Candidatus Omnitrophota bacterium]